MNVGYVTHHKLPMAFNLFFLEYMVSVEESLDKTLNIFIVFNDTRANKENFFSQVFV